MYDFGVDEELFYIVLQDYKCSLRQWRNQFVCENIADALPLFFNIFQQVMDCCQPTTLNPKPYTLKSYLKPYTENSKTLKPCQNPTPITGGP
jgi:hypothetical protein